MGLYFCLFDFKPQLCKTNGYFEIYLFLFVVSESLIWSYSQIVKKKKKRISGTCLVSLTKLEFNVIYIGNYIDRDF